MIQGHIRECVTNSCNKEFYTTGNGLKVSICCPIHRVMNPWSNVFVESLSLEKLSWTCSQAGWTNWTCFEQRDGWASGGFFQPKLLYDFFGEKCVIILHVSQIYWSVITLASFQYLHLVYWKKIQLSTTLLVNSLSFLETALKINASAINVN